MPSGRSRWAGAPPGESPSGSSQVEARFGWGDAIFLAIGALAALHGASEATDVAQAGGSRLPYLVALAAGLLIAASWSWATWFRRTAPARTPEAGRPSKAVVVAAPLLGVVGFALTGLSKAWSSVVFGFIGGFLLAALVLFAVHRAQRRSA